jgi:hypothetical protein
VHSLAVKLRRDWKAEIRNEGQEKKPPLHGIAGCPGHGSPGFNAKNGEVAFRSKTPPFIC